MTGTEHAGPPPAWAVARVASVKRPETRGANPRELADLARRTGLNKRLVRRCLAHLGDRPPTGRPPGPASTTRPDGRHRDASPNI